MEERRRNPRKSVHLRVDFVDGRGYVAMGLARDISLGGMFVEHTAGLSSGETITATFTLPTGQPFKTRAEVVRVNTAGFGMKFVDLDDRYSPDYLQSLETYCIA
jgi:hypothetical protein